MNPFRTHIHRSIADENLQAALDANALRRREGRQAAFASLPDLQERRRHAHAIKAEVIAHLDEYLEHFIKQASANGIHVHRAADSNQAVRIFLEIAHASKRVEGPPLLVAKSKSMVSEEINFNHELEAAGLRVVETDLGEYIVQLRGERPSHIITPAVHLRRSDVGKLFAEKLGIPYTEDISTLTHTARKVLRDVFLNADMGVSGVNFGVVESGTLALVTNEGNGRMCTTIPPVHVALMGIERLLPTLDDLALFLSLLPRSATGQKLGVYTNLVHGPRRPGDPDGPRERHLILVDNGRKEMSVSPLAEALFCIRCGACLNACPVFREIGGHAYLGRDGSIAPYPGPIGSVVSPGLFGCQNFGHLAQASSLCGACREACPVDIDLPGLLLRVRAGHAPRTSMGNQEEGLGLPAALKLGLKGFQVAAASSGLFALFQSIAGILSRIYSPRRAYMRIPSWTGWGSSKDLPRLAVRPFRAGWRSIHQEVHKAPPASSHVSKQVPTTAAEKTPSLVTCFTEELTILGGEVHPVNKSQLPKKLIAFLAARNLERIYVDPAVAQYLPTGTDGLEIINDPDAQLLCGLTGALCGVADTGSLVLVSGEGRPLSASILPAIHAVILCRSQLVATLAEALSLPQVRSASAAVVISGPSRTADIEMTLTVGVHGPGELHVFLIDDSDTV